MGKTWASCTWGAVRASAHGKTPLRPPHRPDLDFELHADDVLVLLGTPEQIATAELLLLGGKH